MAEIFEASVSDEVVMPRTRVYYQDGMHEGPGPPARGVQAIVQDHPEVGVEIVTTSDYYVLENGRWRGVDIFGLFDFLLDSGIVLFGRMIRREEYQEVMRKASADKAGWLPSEKKFLNSDGTSDDG